MNDVPCRFLLRINQLRHCLCRLIFACVLLSIIGSAVAQDNVPASQKPSDVRMVIDISGSMKKNDPKNLRRPAMDMLVKLLPKDSKAGIWTFGQYVNMLIPHRSVDKEWIQKASASANEIKSIAQFTNIGEALEQAAYDYQSGKNDYQKHIVLLTDGMVDIDRDPLINNRERQRIITDILPRYQQAGLTLHTIALSDNADKKLLTQLALATDGRVAVAKTAEELMNAFLQVFNQAVPAEELPFDGESFVIDSSIEEFTALIFRRPGSLSTEIIAPNQEKYTRNTQDDRIVWYHTEQYDLITVQQPLEGEWNVIADVEPQSQITVVSDLSLAVKSMPTNLSVNDSLNTSLALREENKIVKRREFLSLLDIDVSIDLDGKTIWNKRVSDGISPDNGIYPVLLDQFKKEGQYVIHFTVDGKTFQRQFTHDLTVRQPFDIEVNQIEENGRKYFTVQVVPLSQFINRQKTEIVGKLKKPSGTSHIVKFTPTDDNSHWEYQLDPESQGKYTLDIRVTTYTRNDERLDFTPDSLILLNQQDDSVFEPVSIEPSPEIEPVVKTQEPDEVDPVQNEIVEEVPVQEDNTDMTKFVLYGVLGLVNLLIILVVFIIYRKLFGKKPEPENESIVEEESEQSAGFTEPPMDEMMVEDFDEPFELETEKDAQDGPLDSSDFLEDVSDQDSLTDEDAIDLDSEVQDDVLNEMLDEEKIDEDEEMPDFSLDDFGPEGLDDNDENKEIKE